MDFKGKGLRIRRNIDELTRRMKFLNPTYTTQTPDIFISPEQSIQKTCVAIVETARAVNDGSKKLSLPHLPEPIHRTITRTQKTNTEQMMICDIDTSQIIKQDTLRSRLSPTLSRVSTVIAKPMRRRLNSETWEDASIFLMDIVSFTTICSSMSNIKSTDMLQRFFRRVDVGLTIFGMTLIDIIGDAYMAINTTDTHPERTVRFAIFCINAASKTLIDTENPSRGKIQIRAAVHSGNIHSMVLETTPFRYTIIGPSLEIVKFLETNGKAGMVHCSAAVISKINNTSNDTDLYETNVDSIRKNAKPIIFTRMDAMQLSVTQFNILSLDVKISIPEYINSLKTNNETYTYLIQERRLITSIGEVIVCPYTLRFIRNSIRFCDIFEFQPHELRNIRMLSGPRTDIKSFTAALKSVFESRQKDFTTSFLYKKNGDTVGIMAITLTYQAKSSGSDENGEKWILDSGVCILCSRI
jgi:class 3 adenylate cyclase